MDPFCGGRRLGKRIRRPITDFMCGHETKVLLPTCPNKNRNESEKQRSVGRSGVVWGLQAARTTTLAPVTKEFASFFPACRRIKYISKYQRESVGRAEKVLCTGGIEAAPLFGKGGRGAWLINDPGREMRKSAISLGFCSFFPPSCADCELVRVRTACSQLLLAAALFTRGNEVGRSACRGRATCRKLNFQPTASILIQRRTSAVAYLCAGPK